MSRGRATQCSNCKMKGPVQAVLQQLQCQDINMRTSTIRSCRSLHSSMLSNAMEHQQQQPGLSMHIDSSRTNGPCFGFAAVAGTSASACTAASCSFLTVSMLREIMLSSWLLQSFEALNQRAVAVVVDPVQSVKGKVVIDAFRLISPQTMMLGQEPRQTTSNLGHLHKPSIQALIHGLNRHYYSIGINYR